jgi:hypothetical protein
VTSGEHQTEVRRLRGGNGNGHERVRRGS